MEKERGEKENDEERESEREKKKERKRERGKEKKTPPILKLPRKIVLLTVEVKVIRSKSW
jgi:hypothetical protein